MYLYGMGVEENYEKAFYYLGMVYDLTGEIEGMREVSESLPEIDASYTGRNAHRKYIDHLYEAAHLSDNKKETAIIDILKGNELLRGVTYPRDAQEAIKCYEEAAELGESVGNELIGEMYFHGDGVEQDYKKAFGYFQKSRKYRSFAKHYYLGEMYLHGLYVKKNIDRAIREFRSITEAEGEYKELDKHYELAREELKRIEGEA